MKIFAISDLHISTNTDKPMDVFGSTWKNYLEKIEADWQSKVGKEDLVLISGDISWAMDLTEALNDISRFSSFNGKKVMIKGNHDYWWKSITNLRKALPENVFALQNDALRFDGAVIAGSRAWTVPGSPDFTPADEKIYLRESERLKLSLNNAKSLMQEGDKLIAMVHYPPFNARRESTLYTELFKEYGVNAVVYGHLHGKDVRADRIVYKDGISYYLTSCDLVNNTLVEIEV